MRLRRWRAGAVGGFLALTVGGCPSPNETRMADAATVGQFVEAQLRSQRIPGMAVAVVRNGQPVVVQGYGFANVEHGVPVTAETVFQIASIGKMFTAAAVLLLVEDGKIRLDDTISQFFPAAPPAWRSITIRHLLNSTSGIPDYTDGRINYQQEYAESTLVRFAMELPLEFRAGTRWNYSSTGYVLLGAIIGKVAGEHYGDYLSRRVFRPLGMHSTRVISEADIIPHRAAGYRLVGDSLKNQEWVSPSLNTTADGSLYSTLNDLLKWDNAVRTQTLLSKQSWAEMLSPARLASGATYPYGFGWELDERGGGPMHWHSGSWQGFRSIYARFSADSLSVIVLANLRGINHVRLMEGIVAIVAPQLSADSVVVAAPDSLLARRAEKVFEDIRAGRLESKDFAYAPDGFFPGGAKDLQERLSALGRVMRRRLVRNDMRGDDHMLVYELEFANRVVEYSVGFAPDGRVAVLWLWP